MLDKSAGYPLETEEHAINPLAGGIARHGYQCGMIWGAAMAASFAGSIGLSGGGCGVLGAAVWLNEMKGHQQGDNINAANARAEEVVKTFLHASGNKFTCAEITGRRFNSIGDHADFIRQGGCAQIIESCTLKQLPAAVDANKKSVLVQN